METSFAHGWRRLVVQGFRLALIALVALVFGQAVIAGQFLSGRDGWLPWHELNGTAGVGGVVILQTVLAVLIWFPGRGPAWPAAGSLLAFAAVWLQIEAGFATRLAVHVPLGMALFGLALGLLVGTRRLVA